MLLSGITTSVTAIGALVPASMAACTLANLQDAANTYLSSVTAGAPQPALANATYQENNKAVDIKKGLLSQAMKIDHNKTTFDTTACATYAELIITNPKAPYVIGTQVRLDANNNIDVVDTIATSTGDWQFNATKSLSLILKEDWGTIPAEKRDTRATLQAAADAYLDLWSQNATKPTVPWGVPCDRMEGSSYTGKGTDTDSCNVGIPSGNEPPNTDRRYVIDETVGSVSVLCVFQTMANAADSHEFRLNSGKLRYVHTMTVFKSG
jgi:hypothetical protein